MNFSVKVELLEPCLTKWLRERKGCTLLLLALTATVSWAPEASGCSLPPPGWVVQAGYSQVPANSALAMSLHCSTNCEPGPVLTDIKLRVEGSPEPVAGSVVLSGGEGLSRWAVFRPDSVLEVGRRYELRLGDGQPSEPLIRAVDAHTPAPSAVTLSDQLTLRDVEVGPSLCCSIGPEDSCGDYPCHSTQVLTERVLWVTWTDPLVPESGRFLHRVLQPGGAADAPWSWSAERTYLPTNDAATEACYTLELKSLIDDSIHRFDERCVALPDDVQLGLHDAEPAALTEFLGSCHGPPDGFEGKWCTARTARCVTYPEPACEGVAGAGGDDGNVAERCAALGGGGARGGATSDGSSGETGISGSSGVQAGSGASAGGASGSAGTRNTAVVTTSGGCSVPGRSRASAIWGATFGLLFGVQLLRKRSRKAR